MGEILDYSAWRRMGIVGRIIHLREVDVRNDIELTREILAQIQQRTDLIPQAVQVHGYEPVLVMRHVKRLLDDGMLEGTAHQSLSMQAPMVMVTDLTTQGHAFLAALEQGDIWDKLTNALSPGELAALSMKEIAGIAKDLAVKAVRNKLGI